MWSAIRDFLIRRMIDVGGKDMDVSKFDNSLDVERWVNIYEDKASWVSDDIYIDSRGLPAAIVSDLANKVVVDLETRVVGGQRAEYVDKQYQRLVKRLRIIVEQMLVQGSGILKPFASGGKIGVEYIKPNRFIPLHFDDFGNLVNVVFIDKVKKGKYVYTKLETHDITPNGTYTVTNEAYLGNGYGPNMGTEVPLSTVKAWEDLEPEVYSEGNKHPLYVYIKTPFSNNKDINSPLGVSVFSKVEGLLRDHDVMYNGMLWEYEGSELAVTAPRKFFDKIRDSLMSDSYSSGSPRLKRNRDRLYVQLDIDSAAQGAGGGKLDVFSPTIRHESYAKGIELVLRNIEYNVGLGYGELSKQDSVDKTAEEVKASKKRSYDTVREIQNDLQIYMERVVHIIDVMAEHHQDDEDFRLPHKDADDQDYDIPFSPDKSIIVDKKADLMLTESAVSMGAQRKEYLLMEIYGITIEEAIVMLPMEARKEALEVMELNMEEDTGSAKLT